MVTAGKVQTAFHAKIKPGKSSTKRVLEAFLNLNTESSISMLLNTYIVLLHGNIPNF